MMDEEIAGGMVGKLTDSVRAQTRVFIATTRAACHLEMVAETLHDLASSCDIDTDEAASGKWLFGIALACTGLQHGPVNLPQALAYTWKLLEAELSTPDPHYPGTMPMADQLQCLHDSCVILECLKEAAVSTAALPGSLQTCRQDLAAALGRLDVVLRLAGLLATIEQQLRHQDQQLQAGSQGACDNEVMEVALEDMQSFLYQAGKTFVFLVKLYAKDFKQSRGRTTASASLPFDGEDGVIVAKALGAVCCGVRRYNRSVVTRLWQIGPDSKSIAAALKLMARNDTVASWGVAQAASMQLASLSERLLKADVDAAPASEASLALQDGAALLGPLASALDCLLLHRLVLQRLVVAHANMLLYSAAGAAALDGVNATVPPCSPPECIENVMDAMCAALEQCGQRLRGASRLGGYRHGFGRAAALGATPEGLATLRKMHKLTCRCLAVRPLPRRLGPLGVMEAEEVVSVSKVHVTVMNLLQSIYGEADSYSYHSARDLVDAGTLPLVALAAAMQSQQPPPGTSSQSLFVLTKWMQRLTTWGSLAVAGLASAKARPAYSEYLSEYASARSVGGGGSRVAMDDAAAAAARRGVQLSLSAVRQAALRLSRKAATDTMVTYTGKLRDDSSTSLQELFTLLASTLACSLKPLQHHQQPAWSATPPGPHAPAVAAAVSLHLLPALVSVTGAALRSSCARLEASASAVRLAEAAKEVDMAQAADSPSARQRLLKDRDAVKDVISRSLSCVTLCCKGTWSAARPKGPEVAEEAAELQQPASRQAALCQLLALQSSGVMQLASDAAEGVRCMAQQAVEHGKVNEHRFALASSDAQLTSTMLLCYSCAAGMLQLATVAVSACAHAGPRGPAFAQTETGDADVRKWEQRDGPGQHAQCGASARDRASDAAEAVVAAAACSRWCAELLASGLLQALAQPERAPSVSGAAQAAQAQRAYKAGVTGVEPPTRVTAAEQVARGKPLLQLLAKAIAALEACVAALCRSCSASRASGHSADALAAAAACNAYGVCSHELRNGCSSKAYSSAQPGDRSSMTPAAGGSGEGTAAQRDRGQAALVGCRHSLESALMSFAHAAAAVAKCEQAVKQLNISGPAFARDYANILQVQHQLKAAIDSGAPPRQREALRKQLKQLHDSMDASNGGDTASREGRWAAAAASEALLGAVLEVAAAARAVQAASAAALAAAKGVLGEAASAEVERQCALGRDWGLLATHHPLFRDTCGSVCGNPMCEGPTCSGGDGTTTSWEVVSGMGTNQAMPCPGGCGVQYCSAACLEESQQHGHLQWCGLFRQPASPPSAAASALSSLMAPD